MTQLQDKTIIYCHLSIPITITGGKEIKNRNLSYVDYKNVIYRQYSKNTEIFVDTCGEH